MEKYVQQREEALKKQVIPQNAPADLKEFWDAAVA